MAPLGKSSRGRGGGTKPKDRTSGGKRVSSSSSNPTNSNRSPPSVTRKSLPPQYRVSPGQTSASGSHRRPLSNKRSRPDPTVSQPPSSHPPPSQSPPSQSPPSQPPASHPTVSHPTAAQLHFTPPPISRDLHPFQHEPEEEEEEDYIEEDLEMEEDEPLHPPPDEGQWQRHREAQITLEQLLTQPGREILPRLSQFEGEGLWFTRNRSVLVAKIGKILKEKFRGPWYSWSVTPIDVQDRYFIQLAVCVD